MRNNRIEVTQLLLEYGSNPDICDNTGNTALMYAISNENLRMFELLLLYIADPFIVNNMQKSILEIAQESDNHTLITNVQYAAKFYAGISQYIDPGFTFCLSVCLCLCLCVCLCVSVCVL